MRYEFGIWLAAALALGAGAAVSGDQLSDWQKGSQAAHKQFVNQVFAQIQPLDPKNPARPMHDVETIDVEHGNLILHTTIASTQERTSGSLKVKLDSSADWSRLMVDIENPVPPGTSAIPRSFEFQTTRFYPDKTLTVTVTKVNGGATTIDWFMENPQGFAVVKLTQDGKDPDYARPHACQVTLTGNLPGFRRKPPVTLTSKDFAVFEQEHPAVARDQLSPIFHLLGDDSACAVDVGMAWQVFADTWPADPQMNAKVEKMLPGLATGNFHARKQAREALAGLGVAGAMAIGRLDRSTLTPEQNAQLDAIMMPYRQLPADEAKRSRTDPQFLLDCLYVDDAAIRKRAIEQLRKTTKLDLPFDPSAGDSDRTSAIAAIRDKLARGKFLAAEP